MTHKRIVDLALGFDTQWANSLAVAEKYADLSTPRRRAAFLGQIFHESAGLTKFEENMNYTAERLMVVWPARFPTLAIAKQYAKQPKKLANYVYANRMGNGSVESGDGHRYHGRSPVHLTGKNNYIAVSKNLGKDFVNNPDDVLLPENLMLVAADYWKSNKLNALADAWDIAAISKKVNGGTLGLQERIQLSNWALEAYTGLEKIKT